MHDIDIFINDKWRKYAGDLNFSFNQRESEVSLHKATSLPESPSNVSPGFNYIFFSLWLLMLLIMLVVLIFSIPVVKYSNVGDALCTLKICTCSMNMNLVIWLVSFRPARWHIKIVHHCFLFITTKMYIVHVYCWFLKICCLLVHCNWYWISSNWLLSPKFRQKWILFIAISLKFDFGRNFLLCISSNLVTSTNKIWHRETDS